MYSLFRVLFVGSVLAPIVLPTQVTADGISYNFPDYFTGEPSDARNWLRRNNFAFKSDTDVENTKYTFTPTGLTIETLTPANSAVAHYLTNRNAWIAQPAQATFVWGVKKYPRGADWDRGEHQEAMAVYVLFGETGTFSAPYAIGFFLCKNGATRVYYTPRHFGSFSRYVCWEKPLENAEITTTVDLQAAFTKAFENHYDFDKGVPPVSGIGFETDTSTLGAGVTSSAWVKSIQITPKRQ